MTAEKQIEEQIYSKIMEETGLEKLPDWLIEGIKKFIDTFMTGRINFRVYPFEEKPDFCALANLKKDCFVDDLDNLLFVYGSRPTVKLTIFGLVTSVPGVGDRFKPVIGGGESGSEEANFEKAFGDIFGAFCDIERLISFSRYPSFNLYPIAIYRSIC